jgi:hypothetical protein
MIYVIRQSIKIQGINRLYPNIEMFNQSRIFLLACYLVLSMPAFSREANNPRTYKCERYNNQWSTVIYQNYSKGPFLVFKHNDIPDWSPEKRCNRVSERLELNERKDNLDYFVPGRFNNMEVVCASKTNQPKQQCQEEEVLFTVKQGDTAKKAIETIDDSITKTAARVQEQQSKVRTEVIDKTGKVIYTFINVDKAIIRVMEKPIPKRN